MIPSGSAKGSSIPAIPIFLCAFILALGPAACGKPAAQRSAPAGHPPAGGADSQSGRPDSITLASGGGFAGAWEGFTLARDGKVSAWRSAGAGGRAVSWTRTGSPDSLAAFARALRAHAEAGLSGTGNMTMPIELAGPDTTLRWSLPGAEPSPRDPGPFRSLYGRIRAYCLGLAP